MPRRTCRPALVDRARDRDREHAASTRDEAERHLRALVGRDDARLHDDQWAAIESLVVEQSRVLVVQQTGWGSPRSTSSPPP